MERETETPKKTTTDPDTTVASRIDPVRIGAVIVTGASAAFTAWTVWDMLKDLTPDALALGLGVGVEALWLWLLAIEWRQAGLTGQVHRLLTLTGWVLAGAAAAVLIAHGVTEGSWVLLALAVFPVASKGGWHWLTHSHAARTLARLAERARRRDRAAALSTDLTEDDEVELAEIRRRAAKAKAKAKAEAELAAAEAEADRLRQEAEAAAERVRQETEHQMRQDALRRSLEAQMAAQRADADLLKQRFALEQELRIMRPIGAGPAIGNEQVPDDASAITGPAGFGAGLFQARAQHTGTNPGTNADLHGRAHAVAVGGTKAGTNLDLGGRADLPDHQRRLAEQAVVNRQRVLDYITEHGRLLSHTEVGDALGMTRTTVRKHRLALAEMGYDVLAPKTD